MLFEKATRLKLRFTTEIGNLMAEDLWDLPMTVGVSLDNIAKTLNKEIKEDAEESFVVKNNKTNALLELKFDIVKHIIDVRLKDLEIKDAAAKTKAYKEEIMAIIEDKQKDNLRGESIDKLKSLLDDL